jgi:hypothetical protein
MGKRHHYVPQFYLKHFCIKDRPNIIWVYKRGEEPKDINITNVCVRERYYTVTVEATKEKSEQFETMFTKLENAAAPIFRRLVNEEGPLYFSKDELLVLTNFIGFQYLRGPGFREKILQGDVHQMMERMKEITKDKETFREATKEMYSDPEDEDLEERRQRFIEATEYVKEGKVYFKRERGEEGLTLSLMMDVVEEILPLIFHRRWAILRSKMEGVFITSDNPVLIMATDNNQQTEIEAFKTGMIILPISPSRCLVLEPGRVSHSIPVLPTNFERVKRINEGVISSAYETVLAHYKAKPIKRNFDRTKARECFKPIEFRSVESDDAPPQRQTKKFVGRILPRSRIEVLRCALSRYVMGKFALQPLLR